jgi:hypothetical protein
MLSAMYVPVAEGIQRYIPKNDNHITNEKTAVVITLLRILTPSGKFPVPEPYHVQKIEEEPAHKIHSTQGRQKRQEYEEFIKLALPAFGFFIAHDISLRLKMCRGQYYYVIP